MKKFIEIVFIVLALILLVVLAFIPGYLVVSLVHWNLDITKWHWLGRIVFGVYLWYTLQKAILTFIEKFKKYK